MCGDRNRTDCASKCAHDGVHRVQIAHIEIGHDGLDGKGGVSREILLLEKDLNRDYSFLYIPLLWLARIGILAVRPSLLLRPMRRDPGNPRGFLPPGMDSLDTQRETI